MPSLAVVVLTSVVVFAPLASVLTVVSVLVVLPSVFVVVFVVVFAVVPVYGEPLARGNLVGCHMCILT